jgi:hypothetical protein
MSPLPKRAFKVCYLLEIKGLSTQPIGQKITSLEKDIQMVLGTMVDAILTILNKDDTLEIKMGKADCTKIKESETMTAIAQIKMERITRADGR